MSVSSKVKEVSALWQWLQKYIGKNGEHQITKTETRKCTNDIFAQWTTPLIKHKTNQKTNPINPKKKIIKK